MLYPCRGLSETDLRAIADLQQRVVAVDGGRLKLEWPSLWSRPAEQVNDFCFVQDQRVVGFAGIYSHGNVPEVAGMIDPQHRRNGIGSTLLDAVRAELASRTADAMLLVCPRTPAGGADFARTNGGADDHSEYALELWGEPTPGPSWSLISLRPATPADADRIRTILRDGFGHDDTTIAERLDTERDHVAVVYGDTEGGKVIGYLRQSFDRRDGDPVPVGGVYGFAIDPAYRGRGIGRDVLRRCCVELIGRGAQRIGLEVATDNEHALGLYTSLGFEQTTTEDYFRLAIPAG